MTVRRARNAQENAIGHEKESTEQVRIKQNMKQNCRVGQDIKYNQRLEE